MKTKDKKRKVKNNMQTSDKHWDCAVQTQSVTHTIECHCHTCPFNTQNACMVPIIAQLSLTLKPAHINTNLTLEYLAEYNKKIKAELLNTTSEQNIRNHIDNKTLYDLALTLTNPV